MPLWANSYPCGGLVCSSSAHVGYLLPSGGPAGPFYISIRGGLHPPKTPQLLPCGANTGGPYPPDPQRGQLTYLNVTAGGGRLVVRITTNQIA